MLWAAVAVLSVVTPGTHAAVAGVAVVHFVLAVLVMLMHVACAALDSRLRRRVCQAAACTSDRSYGQAAAAAAPATEGGVVYGLRYSPDGRIRSFELHEVL